MSVADLFQSLARASSSAEAFELLDGYAEEEGLDGHEELPLKPLGDQDNNRGLIEALASVDASGFEKVMNGHDALIDLWLREGRFETDPQNPAEALAELGMSEEPSTWLITSRDKSPSGPGRPPKRANLTIVDRGIGIPASRFADTIMSLQGSNKITDPRFAGSFGYGGSTLYRFSELTLVYSRYRDRPNEVAFTVVLRVQKENWKSYSYHWLHDGHGNALTAEIGEIPSALLADPEELDSQNLIEFANNRIILPNAHGTGIRVFGLSAFTDQGAVYNMLRTLGFGIPVRVGIRHGIPATSPEEESEDTRGGRRRIYNVRGLRFALNEPRSKGAFPVLYRQAPVPVLDGQATLECWILGESERARSAERQRSGSVVQRLLGAKDDVTSPIFVTLNGQAHATLPTAVLLRRAGLPYLAGNLLIEVNCDAMDARERGVNFASNREHVTDKMRDELKVEIEKFLREVGAEDGPLGRLNKKFRDDLLATSSSEAATKSGVERFAKMIHSSLAGAIFSSVGRSHARLRGAGKVRTLGSPDKRSGRKTEIALQATPDWLEVRKSTVQQGESEYVTVRTNALNDFGDALTIELPSFLTRVEHVEGAPAIPLKDGRASYYMRCAPDVPVGTLGTITVTLDRTRLSLPALVDTTTVSVVKRERAEPRQKPAASNGDDATGLPDLKVWMVKPSETSWAAMNAGSLDPTEVAYFAVPNEAEGYVDIYVNAEFSALTHVANEAQRRFREPSVVERLRDDYQFAIKLAVLSSLEAKIEELFAESQHSSEHIHRVNSATAKVFAMAAWESLDRFARAGSKAEAA
jgi:hypothetical protein